MSPFAAAVVALLSADPARVTLHHSQAEGCPDQQWLESNVTARLGYAPFVADAPLKASTRLECNPKECTGTLELSKNGGAPRQRTLTAGPKQCRELAESLALALSLAVDPQLLSRPAPAPEAPKPEPAPAPVPPPAVVLVEAPKTEKPRTPVFFAGSLTGFGSFGLSPYPTGGGALGFGVRVGWFGVALEGRAEIPQSANVNGGNVTSNTLMGTLLVCGHFHGLGVCLSGSGGALQVTGQLPGGNRATSPLVLAGGRVMYEWMFVSWLGLRVFADVDGVLTRTTVDDYMGPVWVTAPVALRGGAGLVTVF
ncbi:MAG: hypothetical protein QM723_26805 [Myxococcaceae bacterium]